MLRQRDVIYNCIVNLPNALNYFVCVYFYTLNTFYFSAASDPRYFHSESFSPVEVRCRKTNQQTSKATKYKQVDL